MDKKEIRAKLDKFIEDFIGASEKYCLSREDVRNNQGIAFGAAMFCIELFPEDYENFSSYWDEKRERFQEIMRTKAQ